MNYQSVVPFDLLSTLCWTARALSLISIFVLLLFYIGEGFNPLRVSLSEWALFVFFPFAVIVGMIVAWWKEGLGGVITLSGWLGFYVVHAWLAEGHFPRGWAFTAFAAPGFFFLTYWMLARSLHRWQ
jgi:hypothetical protein